MATFFQLFDFESGNIIAVYPREIDACAALRQLAAKHGVGELRELGLLRLDGDDITLVAMDENLVDRALGKGSELILPRRSA